MALKHVSGVKIYGDTFHKKVFKYNKFGCGGETFKTG